MGIFGTIEAMGAIDEGLRTWTTRAGAACDVVSFVEGWPSASVPVQRTGDLLPTFVGPDDAKRYISETDTGYTRLDQQIQASAVSAAFKSGWSTQLKGWQAFRDEALKEVGWFNAKATMEQTDRWSAQLQEWQASFAKAAPGALVGPAPVPPGQGTGQKETGQKLETAFTVAAVVGGLFAVGYLIRAVRA